MARRRERSPDAAMLLEILQVFRDEPEYTSAANRITEIEQRYIAVAGIDEQLALRHSAARMAFAASTDKGAPFEEVTECFRRMCEIGFPTLFSELVLYVEFAYACASHRRKDEGLAALDKARTRLEGSALKPGSATFREQSAMIERCRRRLSG